MDSHATPYKYTLLSRGVLGGLFLGMITAVLNLAFDFIYRKITGYQIAEFVNINSIIFFTIPTIIAAGIVYSIIMRYVKRGLLVYTILAVVLTVIVAFIPLGPNMLPSGDPMPASARGLTMGIEILTGIMGAFALPYIVEHPRIWGE